MLEWHEHVQRSERYGCLGKALLEWHDQSWLTGRGLQWVSSNGSAYSRNRPNAGRLGTRLVGGQPQPRWCEGIALARELVRIREIDCAAEKVTVGTRIHRAHFYLQSFFAG